MKDIVSILEPFEQATRKLSQDKVPTLNLVIPEFMKLKSTLVRLKSSISHTSCLNLIDILLKELDGKFLPWHKYELMSFFLTPDFHRLGLNDLLQDGRMAVNQHLQSLDLTPSNQALPSQSTPSTDLDEYAILMSSSHMAMDIVSPSPLTAETHLHEEIQLFLANDYVPSQRHSRTDFLEKST